MRRKTDTATFNLISMECKLQLAYDKMETIDVF